MRDFLAADVARRRHVVGVIQAVYESFGFVPLETPTIENLSTLLGKYGPEATSCSTGCCTDASGWRAPCRARRSARRTCPTRACATT
ncbi:MAG: hypothetical protein IPK67_01790 [Planctomycetes bacterium]|nr:hypothetical protein [Planctomycetota bacterium]